MNLTLTQATKLATHIAGVQTYISTGIASNPDNFNLITIYEELAKFRSALESKIGGAKTVGFCELQNERHAIFDISAVVDKSSLKSCVDYLPNNIKGKFRCAELDLKMDEVGSNITVELDEPVEVFFERIVTMCSEEQ